MKKIFPTLVFVCMTLACSYVNAQAKPKKPVNNFEGAEKALLVKTPKNKTTKQFGGGDFGQQRRAKPGSNRSTTASKPKAKPRSAKGSQ